MDGHVAVNEHGGDGRDLTWNSGLVLEPVYCGIITSNRPHTPI